ncbi:hypothetical protein D046_1173B, partial [Vibrio parahaemolyticus V-223/04]
FSVYKWTGQKASNLMIKTASVCTEFGVQVQI